MGRPCGLPWLRVSKIPFRYPNLEDSMKRQQHHPEYYASLKTAFRLLIQRVGGFEAAASCTGASPARLHVMADLQQDDRYPRLDYVADLERVAGEPLVTSILAGATHHRLSLLPQAVRGNELRAIAATLRRGADLAAEHAEAMEDGRLSDEERAELDQHLAAVAQAADAARAAIAASAERGATAKLRAVS
jgi:hypothetical protein